MLEAVQAYIPMISLVHSVLANQGAQLEMLKSIDKQLAEVPAPNTDLPAGLYVPSFQGDSPIGSLYPLRKESNIGAAAIPNP